jgi:hypothetical protein
MQQRRWTVFQYVVGRLWPEAVRPHRIDVRWCSQESCDLTTEGTVRCPSLPPELADPVERLRAKLVEVNGSEQTCMINVVASASQGKRFPEVQ